MDKKYQIFVSSTFKDLVEERNAVREAIIRKRHIPVGMEYFSASSLSQLDYIKKMLNFVDYYVLIIGGRYGTIDKVTGKSFTHLEFEYAIERNIPIMVFYPQNPGGITQDKLDDYPEGKEKLKDFISIAMNNRMSRPYSNPSDLKNEFSLSFDEVVDDFPRTGWIRGDNDSNVELLIQLNNVRNENEDLKYKLNQCTKEIGNSKTELEGITDLAMVEDNFVMHYGIKYDAFHPFDGYINAEHETNIRDLLSSFGHNLVEGFSKAIISDCLKQDLSSEALAIVKKEGDAYTPNGDDYSYTVIIPERTLMQILISFEVNGIIYSESYDSYSLSEKGKKIVYKALVFKKNPEISF